MNLPLTPWYDFRDLSGLSSEISGWVGADWLGSIISGVLGALGILMIIGPVLLGLIWLERKVISRFQQRYGPNRVGPKGLLQPVADAVKLVLKEELRPRAADKFLFLLPPILVFIPGILVWGVIPFGPNMQIADLNVGVLFLLAISSTAVVAIFIAGWSSNNKYTLLGGIRSAAQLTAYEIPLLVTVLSVVVISGSFNMIEVIEFQANSGVWNIFLLPLGGLLFLVVMVAEVERIPFDMPEAEAELVEGWWTEYGGMRWGLMFAAEYLRTYAACLLFAHFFLGGWEAPFEDTIPFISMVPHVLWVFLKAWFMFIFFVWFRAALHRVRTDQILEFGWCYLLPLSLVNLAMAAALRLWVYDGVAGEWPILVPILITSIGLALFVLLAIDEDPEALAAQTRPYSVQTTDAAGPGQHRE